MRILGVNIPDNKRTEVALTYLYGVGISLSRRVLDSVKVDGNKRAQALTAEEVNKIQNHLEKNFQVEGALRQVIRRNIQRLKELQVYRGTRHMRRLPVRGQRSHTNARTRKGPRKAIAGKKKVTK